MVLRRLNREEYRNTIRDLFGLKMVDFDPTTTFPPDDTIEGFDNVGEGLVTSDHLLRNYLYAARQVADKVVRPGPKPEMIRYEKANEAPTNTLEKDARAAAGECLSNSVNHWASCNWTNAAEYRLPANTSFVFQHARFGENPDIRMRISVIIQMNPCAFRFPSIHGARGDCTPDHWRIQHSR